MELSGRVTDFFLARNLMIRMLLPELKLLRRVRVVHAAYLGIMPEINVGCQKINVLKIWVEEISVQEIIRNCYVVVGMHIVLQPKLNRMFFRGLWILILICIWLMNMQKLCVIFKIFQLMVIMN